MKKLEKMWFCLLLVCLSGSIKVSAQSFEAWANILGEKAKRNKQVHMDIVVKAFDERSNTALYQTNMKLIKDQENYYYRTGDVEMVGDADYQLNVNHAYKVIECLPVNNIKHEQALFDLDSLLGLYESPKRLYEDDQRVYFEAQQRTGMVDKVIIHINKQKQELEKLVYSYQSGKGEADRTRVEMAFQTRSLQQQDQHFLNTSRFVASGLSAEKPKLVPEYSNYHLHINQ